MTHPRELIRKHLARTLVRAGAWADAIFVNRAVPIDESEHFPNVCIFSQNERTLAMTNQHEAKQELALLVEVREMRQANLQQSWRQSDGTTGGLPTLAGADDRLDDACEVIENIVLQQFSNTRLNIDGVLIDFDEVSEVNTDISNSAEGIVPFLLAQIEFKVVYRRCFEVLDPISCSLEFLLGEIRHTGCTGPPGSSSVVPVQTRHLQPLLAAPP